MPRSLLNDKFFDSFSTSVLSCEEAESLPPECYVDPEFFAFEKETMFSGNGSVLAARPG